MKSRFLSLSAVCLSAALVAAPAMADDVDFSKVKCSDFIAGSKDDAILMLTWLEGYFTKKGGPPVMYGRKAAEDAQNIRDYCIAHGEVDVFKAALTVISGK